LQPQTIKTQPDFSSYLESVFDSRREIATFNFFSYTLFANPFYYYVFIVWFYMANINSEHK